MDDRGKQEKKKIEDKATWQVTFSRRKKGLIKKAYELSVLCDIDIALIMFSPSGRLTQFSGIKRTEEVLNRYMNLANDEREKVIQNREYWIKTLNQIMTTDDKELRLYKGEYVNSQMEELQQEVDMLRQQLQIAEEQLRVFEPDQSLEFKSMGELQSMEERLLNTLELVLQRKEYLSSNHPSYYDTSSSEGMLTSFENQVTNESPAPFPHWDISSTREYPLLQGSSSKMGEGCVNYPTRGNFPMWPPPSSLVFPPIQLEAGDQSKAEEEIPPDEGSSGEGA